MRKRISFIAVVLSFTLLATPLYAASPKAGASCSRVGATSTYAGKKYTCVKSGSKLVWNKGVAVTQAAAKPTASPSPAVSSIEKAPTSFDDLYENRKGISRAAWQKISETIKANKSKVGLWEVFTGPNTKPFFEGYPLALDLVSRGFPNSAEAGKVLIVRYNFKDLEWATSFVRTKLTDAEFAELDRIEGGRLLSSNCEMQTSSCQGSKQLSTFSGLALILQGVQNKLDSNDPVGSQRFETGMLEAHEYFHSLQRIAIMGKSNVWPHAWFREGSAEWVQNAAINYNNFDSYAYFLKKDCTGQCSNLTEAQIVELLQKANDNYMPGGYEQFLNYSLGSKFIEILVALKGQESIIDMYSKMAKQQTFNEAFKNVYGVEFSDVIPILAKTVYANIKG